MDIFRLWLQRSFLLVGAVALVGTSIPTAMAADEGSAGPESVLNDESLEEAAIDATRSESPDQLAATPSAARGLAGAQADESPPPGIVVISGSGFGHGIGLSQYGTLARVVDGGQSYTEVLAAYYTGTALTTDTSSERLWVNLNAEVVKVELKAKKLADPYEPVVVSRSDPIEESVSLTHNDTVTIEHLGIVGGGRTCSFATDEFTSEVGSCSIDLDWDGFAGDPTTRVAITRIWYANTGSAGAACTHKIGGTALECATAFGAMRIRPDDQDEAAPADIGFHVVAEIDLDDYARGIGEVPYSWAAGALQTQAVAARTYARYADSVRAEPSARPWCWCDIYDTSIDQVYLGYGFDDPAIYAPGANWVAAVEATPNEILTKGGSPIGAFYGSSNGGASENNEDIWAGAPLSYLRSIDDPWSLTSANPYAAWEVEMTTSFFASVLGFDSVASVEITDRFVSGTPSLITVTGIKSGVPATEVFGDPAAGNGAGEQFKSKFNAALAGSPVRSVHINSIAGGFEAQVGWWHQDNLLDVTQPGDRFGSATASGDFNGDGFEDLAIGVPYDGVGGRNDAGLVHVIYGSSGGLTNNDEQVWHQDKSGVAGTAEAGDRFGAALSSGDYNNDGKDDLAIGVPGEDWGTISDAGAVQVLYGSGSGIGASGDQLWSQSSTGIKGTAEPGDALGSALASGDFDNDGRSDLAAGAPGESWGSVADAGAVNVLFGSSSGLSATDDEIWGQDTAGIAGGAEANDSFGAALAAGDFNGDNRSDLAIAAVGEDWGSIVDAGAVHVIYGTTNGLSGSDDDLWSQDSAGILGSAEAGDRFGYALAAGDFDRDGNDDLAIGVPYEALGSITAAGMVNVLFGSGTGVTASGDRTISQATAGISGNPEAGDHAGYAVAAGDIDGDGSSDLIIGVPDDGLIGANTAGVAMAVFGVDGAGFGTDDVLWHQALSSLQETAETGDRLGAAVSTGDFNGDGRADTVISVPTEDLSGDADAGGVHVIHGSGDRSTLNLA